MRACTTSLAVVALTVVTACAERLPTSTKVGSPLTATPSNPDDNANADPVADLDPDTDTDPEDTGADCGPDEIVSYFVSPDDSNSMSSPVQARDAVWSGAGIGQTAIRPWEFMNYYAFDYPPGPPDSVGLDVQLTRDADLPEGDYRLQIAVTSEARDAALRRPMNLALSIDTSGSMTGNPIARAADVCAAVASSLRSGDWISVVTWSSTQSVLLDGWPVTGADDPTLVGICRSLPIGGSTNLASGLKAAYDLVGDHYSPKRVNRVVLISDGGANTGETDELLIGEQAGVRDEDGVYLVGVGVGESSDYNDVLMDTVTDLGRGADVFIPHTAEAQEMFGPRFEEVVDVAVRDVQLRVDLPPGFVFVRTTAEAVSTDPAAIEPQHLAPNDSVVLFQTIHTCAPEDVGDDTPITVAVTFDDDETFLPGAVERAFTFGELLAAPSPQLRRGAAIAAYADALADPTEERIDQAYARLGEADVVYPGDPDLAEIRAVLDAAQ